MARRQWILLAGVAALALAQAPSVAIIPSGGSSPPPTTVPSVYKSTTAPTLGNFIGTTPVTITACASVLCQCTFLIATSSGAGNGKLNVTYTDALLSTAITSGSLNGNQAFADGHIAMYTLLFNSNATPPVWSVLNVSNSDTFAISAACFVIQ